MQRRGFAIVLSVLTALAFGCSSHSSSPVAGTAIAPLLPHVVQQQGGGPWISFAYNPPFGQYPGGITAGHDGATWYCNADVERVGMDGQISTFALPSGYLCNDQLDSANPMTRNPDGNVYFGWFDSHIPLAAGIGQVTPAGVVTLFTEVTGNNPNVYSITSGSDGNIWAAVGGQVWRMTPQGQFTSYNISGGLEIVRGPDKNLWVYITQANGAGIYRIGVHDGSETRVTTTASWGLIGAADGGLWFSQGRAMGRMDPATFSITSYPLPNSVHPLNMVETLHQNLYFIDTRHSPSTLGRFNYRTHKLEHVTQLGGADFRSLALGSDGNLWLLERSRPQVDVYVIDVITPTPSSLTLGMGQSQPLTVSEKQYNKSLTATTSNASIATVTANGKDSFTVTGVSAGTCSITLSDDKGNEIDVPVAVN